MKSSWVYILECADGSYYTGCTTNLEQRIYQHKSGTFQGYTAIRRPVKLVWLQEFSDPREAIVVERKIKGWVKRKKEALIHDDFKLIHELSRSTKTKDKLKRKSQIK